MAGFSYAMLKPCLRHQLIWINMRTLEVCALGNVGSQAKGV